MIWIILTVALIAVGCGSARRGVPLTGEHQLDSPELRLGHQAFDTYCHQCHPGGAAGLGPGINNRPLPGWLIKFQVRRGLGAMPSFPREAVSSEELDAIVSYLKYLRRLDVRE